MVAIKAEDYLVKIMEFVYWMEIVNVFQVILGRDVKNVKIN